jgi:hypothetical protein
MKKREAIDLIKKEFTIEIIVDDAIPAFGTAWIPDNPEKEETAIVLNLGSCLLCAVTEPDVDFKTLVIETLMHEFGHIVERWVGLEASEERINALVEAYRQKYGKRKNDKNDNKLNLGQI